jgi:chorismate mutase
MGAALAVADENLQRELEDVRGQLDALDRQLVDILVRRFEVGSEAARLKRALGIPVHDPEREAQVISQAREWARSGGLPEPEVADMFRMLVAISRAAQLASHD